MEKNRGNKKAYKWYHWTEKKKWRKSSKSKWIFKILIYLIFRKYSIFKWRMSKKGKWVKTIICFPNKATMKKRKFKMPFFCKKRKKRSKPKWLSIKMNRRNAKTSSDWNKKTKWKIKLDFKVKDWPKWKSMKKEEEKSWWQEKNMKKSVLRKNN